MPRKDPAGLDQRGVRRPGGAPAAGVVSRRGEPDRPAGVLRRREAGGRDVVHGLSPHEQGQHSRRADLQHVRAADAPVRWARGFELHPAGAAARAITIYGDGQQTRSFCYRDDLVEGIIRMMDGPDDFIGPVNLGNPKEFTIKELAELVIELTGAKSKLVQQPLPQDDPHRRQPDITLAKEKLKWEPTTPLRDGLTKTIEWFKSIRISDYRPPSPNY